MRIQLRPNAFTLAAMVALVGILNSAAYSLDLGDCNSGAFTPETPKKCDNKDFCTGTGCISNDRVSDACIPSQGTDWIRTFVTNANRVKVGSCVNSTGDVCLWCSQPICSKGAAYGNYDVTLGCLTPCNFTGYIWNSGGGCF